MTIDILFMGKNRLVLRVNMGFFNFENKILNGLSDIEKKKWVPIFDDDKMFTITESLLERFGTHVLVMDIYF